MSTTEEDDDSAAADFIANSLSSKVFFRTISYRESLTVLTYSLLLEAFIATLNYYGDERFIENWSRVIGITGAMLIILANHVSYRFEHGRSNNLMGRALFDMVFLLCFALINRAYLLIIGQSNQLIPADIGEILGGVVVMIVLIFALEFLVSLLKYLLKFLRCPVL